LVSFKIILGDILISTTQNNSIHEEALDTKIQNSKKEFISEYPLVNSETVKPVQTCEVQPSLQLISSGDRKVKLKKIGKIKKFYCSGKNCRRSFNTKENLEKHEKTHNDTFFTCTHEKCGRRFNLYFNFQV
jgi:hypothetical protein